MRGYIYVILPFQYPTCIEKFSSVIKPKIAQFAFAWLKKGNEFNVLRQKIKFCKLSFMPYSIMLK